MTLKYFSIGGVNAGMTAEGKYINHEEQMLSYKEVPSRYVPGKLRPGTPAERVKAAIQEDVKPGETWAVVTSPACEKLYETYVHPEIKDWIIYEGPPAFNLMHPERAKPSIRLIIFERPLENEAQ